MKSVTHSLIVATILTTAHPVLAQTTTSGSGNAGGTVNPSATMNSSGSVNTPAGSANTGVTTMPGQANTNAHATGTVDTWNDQNTYWRKNYSSRPYYNKSRDYTVYEPAYRYGVDLYTHNSDKTYDQLNQSEIGKNWSDARGRSNLDWSDAQLATRDAYNRMYESRRATTTTR